MLRCSWCTEGTFVCYVVPIAMSNKFRACLEYRGTGGQPAWRSEQTHRSGNQHQTAQASSKGALYVRKSQFRAPGLSVTMQGPESKIFKAARVKVGSNRPRGPLRPTYGQSPQKKSRAAALAPNSQALPAPSAAGRARRHKPSGSRSHGGGGPPVHQRLPRPAPAVPRPRSGGRHRAA